MISFFILIWSFVIYCPTHETTSTFYTVCSFCLVGNYPPRPQYYGPGAPPPGAPSSQPPPGQYQGRQMPNHQYPPGGYQQSWVPPSPGPMSNHVQGKGTPPPPGPSGSPRPINYLKQHLQHKGGAPGPGYMGSQTPPPPQGYGNGPGMHMGGPMGPPHHMGPPSQPMGPPISTPLPPTDPSQDPNAISQDNGVPPSSLSSTTTTTASGGHPVTSVITTGPDGATIDEASQQSTLSNASAGESCHASSPYFINLSQSFLCSFFDFWKNIIT